MEQTVFREASLRLELPTLLLRVTLLMFYRTKCMHITMYEHIMWEADEHSLCTLPTVLSLVQPMYVPRLIVSDTTTSTSLTTLPVNWRGTLTHRGGSPPQSHWTHHHQWCVGRVGVSHFFDFFFVKNRKEQEQSTGKRTWPETVLVKAESF